MNRHYLKKGKGLLYLLGPYVILLLMYLLHLADQEASMLYINTRVTFYKILLGVCFALITYYTILVRINHKQRRIISSLNAAVFTILLLYARLSEGVNGLVVMIMSNELIMVSLVVILILNAIRAWLHNDTVHTFLETE